jgi:IS605 OrfB family transposase
MPLPKSKIFTYQTRITSSEEEYLEKTSVHLSKVERALFRDFCRGKKILSLKNDYLKKYQITARQFNSCRIRLEGKIRSYKEQIIGRISLLKIKIKKLKKHLSNLKDPFKLHQKKRRLFFLETQLKSLEKDQKKGRIRLCFGGKKLFHKQFSLKENGYKDFKAWKKDWREARESCFYLIGSKDESFGNQSCQMIKEDLGFTLKIRLPNIFSDKKVLIIKNIDFDYGKKEIEECLEENEKRKNLRLAHKEYAHLGKALNYLLKKDQKGWRLFISIEREKPLVKSHDSCGVIGIDINENHLALSETDRFGNLIKKWTLSCVTYGKEKNAREAIINDISKKIVDYAVKVEKPLVLENLDFQKKKQTLRESGKKYSRMLSSFSYHKIYQSLESKAFREGIEIHTVNPAYSTLIGQIKFKKRYGLSSHHSAALVLARRKEHFSENPPDHIEVYDEKTKIAFSLPVRNREKHVWSFYSEMNKKKKAAHAVHLSTRRSSEVLRDSEKASVGYG